MTICDTAAARKATTPHQARNHRPAAATKINRSEANRPDLPRQAHLGEGEAMCLAEMVAEAEQVGQVDEGAIQIEDGKDPEVRVHTSFTGSASPDRSRAPCRPRSGPGWHGTSSRRRW
jgi:hypothetical protein